MYAIPRHLVKIFQVDTDAVDEHSLEGSLCCECGCRQFQIKLFAEMDADGVPHVSRYGTDYALVVKGVCKDCGREWLVLDMSRHGYNGYVCHEGVTVPESDLKDYVCTDCGGQYFEVGIGIELEDKAQFIEEVVEDDPEHFSEEDYVDAFDWIVINLTCAHCMKKTDRWIDFETA